MRPLPQPTLLVEKAWLVVPACPTSTVDRLLDGAARACRADELRVRDARGDTGVHLVSVHGAELAALANVMSLGQRIAALHIAGDRGAAALFCDGARTNAVRGTSRAAAAAAAEHVGVAADEVLAVAAAHVMTSQPRIVRGPTSSTADAWNTSVDEGFCVELAAQRLAHADGALADRFDAADYALVESALRTLVPAVPLEIAVRALELRGVAQHRIAALRAWLARTSPCSRSSSS
jgi:hypothetical protein